MNILIVGQGIAGSLFAWEMLQRKHKVTIIDDAHASCASKVAAGILTPITGKRFVLSWEYLRFLEHAKKTYSAISKQFNKQLFETKQTLRIFTSEHERELWDKKKLKPEFKYYHITDEPALKYKKWLNDPFGSKIMQGSAWCQSPQLLESLQNFFHKEGHLKLKKFKHNKLEIFTDGINYNKSHYEYIIFCEGYKIQNNALFNWIPFNHAKGEILLVKANLLNFPNYILNFGKWSLPLGNGLFRVGSTYDWEKLDEVATEEGQKQIMQAIIAQIRIDATVLEHQAGVRPVTKDLIPIVGFHPQHPRVAVINGLGSKGILRSPYLAAHFADVLENKSQIWKDVNVNRFWNNN